VPFLHWEPVQGLGLREPVPAPAREVVPALGRELVPALGRKALEVALAPVRNMNMLKKYNGCKKALG